MPQCDICHQTKSTEDFYRTATDKLLATCKQCRRDRQKHWRHNRISDGISYWKQWYANNAAHRREYIRLQRANSKKAA